MKEVDGRVDLRLGRKLIFIDFISAFTFILDLFTAAHNKEYVTLIGFL